MKMFILRNSESWRKKIFEITKLVPKYVKIIIEFQVIIGYEEEKVV